MLLMNRATVLSLFFFFSRFWRDFALNTAACLSFQTAGFPLPSFLTGTGVCVGVCLCGSIPLLLQIAGAFQLAPVKDKHTHTKMHARM